MRIPPRSSLRKLVQYTFLAAIVLSVLGVLTSGFAPRAWAAASSASPSDSMVIPQGQFRENVLAVGDSVEISGVVTDTVMVVSGTVHLSPTARVATLVNIGGRVIEDRGSSIGSEFSVAFTSSVLNNLAVGGLIVLLMLLAQLALSAALVLVPTLFGWIFASYSEQLEQQVSWSFRRTFLVGLLCSAAVACLASLCALTDFTTIFSLFLLLLYGLVGLIGFTGISLWAVNVVQPAREPRANTGIRVLLGATLLVALGSIPVAGTAALLCAWTAGVGALASRLVRGRRS